MDFKEDTDFHHGAILVCLVLWAEMDPYVTQDPAHQGLWWGGGQTDRERECVQCEVNTPRLEGFASGVLGEGVLGRGPEGNRQSLGRGGWSWGKGHVKRGQRST